MPVMLQVIVWVAIVAVGVLIVATETERHRLRKIEKLLERMLKDAQSLRRGLMESRDEIAALRGEDRR